MLEGGGHDVARRPVSRLPALAHPRCSEAFQLSHRRRDRLFVGLDNPRIATGQGGNRNRLGRRNGEVVKHAPVGALVLLPIGTDFPTGGFLTLRQPLAGQRVQVVAQAQEFFAARDARQPELLRSLALPLPQDPLTLAVVVANAQVLLEVLLGGIQVVLRFG